MKIIENKYFEDDEVLVMFERGELMSVKLGKPYKLRDDKGNFICWSYNSKTEGVNWIAECWIKGKI
jgi:hypothetical protein